MGDCAVTVTLGARWCTYDCMIPAEHSGARVSNTSQRIRRAMTPSDPPTELLTHGPPGRSHSGIVSVDPNVGPNRFTATAASAESLTNTWH
ncbi:hypothetical protein FKM82_020835 [Ascaphus truei]